MAHHLELRDDELLYSSIARMCRYLLTPGRAPFMRELYGRRTRIATTDLPGDCDELCAWAFGSCDTLIVDSWIERSTLFPFHTAFVSPQVRHQARMAMRGSIVGVHVRLGLAAFRMKTPDRFRFCPKCLDAMEAEYGDMWWRRAHQLPGVLICPLHFEILRTSLVEPGEMRHAFVAATRANCPESAHPVIDKPSDSLVEQLGDLAVRSAALLHSPPSSRSYREIRSGYLDGLTRVGLMRSPERVDHQRLDEAFRERWGEVIDAIPALALGSQSGSSWLSRLVQNDRRAAPPTQHVMLKALIEDLASVPLVRPFGSGPWTCRNPIAQHHGQPVIERGKVRSDRGMIYGDFACNCGYLYTRSLSPDGHIGEPRYRRFGPLLAPALTEALHNGKGLRATARMLGLDPKTLMREAKCHGILVPWTTAPSGSPISVPQRRPTKSPTRGAARRKYSRNRRNWFAIDSRLSRSARDAVLTIRASEPPVRVTFAEIERRIARRDWVRKRCIKLPRTFELMVESQEATDEFRHRRLAWHVSKAFASREVVAWKIAREAGLPSHWVDEVHLHIKRACRPGIDESLAA